MNPFAWLGRLIVGLQTKLHGTRILPFVHADLIVVVLLATVAVVAGQATVESLQSGPLPQAVPLARVFSAQRLANRFVEVSAFLLPETRLRYPPNYRGVERPVEFAYVAMLDTDRAKVLLVRFKGDLGHGEPRHVTVSGMLQAPDSLLSRQLDTRGWHLNGVPIERRYVLVAGMTPKPTWLFAPATVISGGLAFALLVAMSRSRSLTPETQPGA